MKEQPFLESDRPNRVLNPDLKFRLRGATTAIRDLRSLGYRVISQDLRTGQPGKVPILVIENGDEALRKRCTSIVSETMQRGTQQITARFRACDLRWQQAAPANANTVVSFQSAGSRP